MVKNYKLCLIGLGTVGKSLVSILSSKKAFIEEKYGISFTVIGIFEIDGLLHDPSGIVLDKIIAGENIKKMNGWREGIKANDEIENLEFDILVEMSWTNVESGEPAFTYIKKALNSGKHVVSSNKGPFLLYYKELMDLSREKGKKIRMEATVGSCLPILQASRTSLHGNEVLRIEAILNGTSNYILTRMANEKLDFDLALKEAQERGYAEADPTLDIEGHDAAGKLVILANTLMGMDKSIKDVKIEGISHLNLQAINLASGEGFIIKHLGIADAEGNLEVKPKLVPRAAPLGAGVSGTLNAVKIVTDLSKEIIFMGRGAGGIEAASAIFSDIIDIVI
ncbi:MAG: homoserine dehydrogenase [Candidatus Hodarchaeota archaeon]